MTCKINFLHALAVAALLASMPVGTHAFPFMPRLDQIAISADRGGQVIQYALRAKKLEKQGRQVRFAGRCESACTLYLSLPKRLTCVAPAASFGFHLPYGVSHRGNRIAADYMMRSYPAWVRSWITANGGLTHRIKTMPYRYAKKHLPPCSTNPSKSI